MYTTTSIWCTVYRELTPIEIKFLVYSIQYNYTWLIQLILILIQAMYVGAVQIGRQYDNLFPQEFSFDLLFVFSGLQCYCKMAIEIS